MAAFVNERLVRKHHHSLTKHCPSDITNRLRFGEDNVIRLAHVGEYRYPDNRTIKPRF